MYAWMDGCIFKLNYRHFFSRKNYNENMEIFVYNKSLYLMNQ